MVPDSFFYVPEKSMTSGRSSFDEPQQNHLSSLRGDQPQSGQRMRGGADFLKLAVWSNDRIVRNGSHSQLL
jgi:hypothetical protein